jgi:hypothetical protein
MTLLCRIGIDKGKAHLLGKASPPARLIRFIQVIRLLLLAAGVACMRVGGRRCVLGGWVNCAGLALTKAKRASRQSFAGSKANPLRNED